MSKVYFTVNGVFSILGYGVFTVHIVLHIAQTSSPHPNSRHTNSSSPIKSFAGRKVKVEKLPRMRKLVNYHALAVTDI
jgi:hypothetical protein